MSGINSANSSWTIVSPEETAAETVRPLEEQTKHREQDPVGDQPTESLESSCLPVKDHQVAEEQKTDPSEDSSTDRPPAVPPSVTDALIPSTDIQSESALDSPNQDAFSESLSHMTPSDEAPGSLLSTETLGGVDLTQQDERHDRTWEEDLKQEGEESDLLSKHIDTSEKPGLNEGRAEDTESERKRLLASLERIGRIEEEEEGEEELFQLPRQREHDNMFSLNKCILGAVILVGLGTILFSGAFMDLDEESNYSTRELRDSEETGKQEWLHPEALPPPVDAENSELQAKLEKGNQQISVLQAQLQAQEEELKAAENQAAEGKMEQLQWQEENSRLKSEVASLPVLQKENERLRRELETLPTLQTELETLRSTVTKLTVPSSGHSADVKQDAKLEKKHKHDTGEKKEWNEGNKSEWKEGERKERKDGSRTAQNDAESGKRHHGKSDKVKERQGKDRKKDSRGDEEKMWKEQDGKKEWAEKTERKKLKKDSRGDEEKMWKDQDGKKEWAQNTERKEWKKDKHDKQRRGKYEEKKELRKDGEAHKVKDMWKKKGKGEFQEHGKDKWEPAEKNWKSGNNGEGRGGVRKSVEDAKKQARDKDDRKQWSHSGKGDKDWRKNGDGLKGKKDSGELKGDQFNLHKPKFTGHHHEVNMWAKVKTPPAQEQSSADATDYWTQQRKRLHRKPKQPQHCHSQEACAQAEGLHPVSFPQFESILQAYLTKAEEAGVDSSKREELRKLAAEFFQDGMFMHDRVNFRKFVKDVSDILEDLVEGDGEEDSELEDEMEMFKREALQRFLATGSGGEQHKGEWKKESPRASA